MSAAIARTKASSIGSSTRSDSELANSIPELTRVTIEVAPGVADLAATALLEQLSAGSRVNPESEGRVTLDVWFPTGDSPGAADVREALEAWRVPATVTSEREGPDWYTAAREFHRPIEIARALRVRPPWEPASTDLIDVVIDPTPTTLESLVGALAGSGFYVDADRARDALRRRRLFNVIEDQTAVKIDLIIRKDRPYSIEELGRRCPAQLGGRLPVALATPEDTVLSKLEWARKGGGSEKQMADVAGVVEVQGPRLDVAYVERWARELDLLDLWLKIAGAPGSPSA